MTQNFDRFKFKVWCFKQKRMLKNLTIWQNGDNENITIQAMGQLCSHHLGQISSISDYRPPILMQSTGLKDKDGKLIYESDIIEWNDGECFYTAVIKWNSKLAMYETQKINGMESLNSLSHILQENDVKIICNIYENPELLNKI